VHSPARELIINSSRSAVGTAQSTFPVTDASFPESAGLGVQYLDAEPADSVHAHP
jgi:hypothetical protein